MIILSVDNEKFEEIVEEYMRTAAGREALANSMVGPFLIYRDMMYKGKSLPPSVSLYRMEKLLQKLMALNPKLVLTVSSECQIPGEVMLSEVQEINKCISCPEPFEAWGRTRKSK